MTDSTRMATYDGRIKVWPTEGRLDDHDRRMAAARHAARWYLGYGSWADKLIGYYLNPAGSMSELEEAIPMLFRRLVGPRVRIDTQRAAEETTERIALECRRGETRTFANPSAAASYLAGPEKED